MLKQGSNQSFRPHGINQTLHKIFVDVKCRVSIITPLKTIDSEVDTQVVVAETIIVGTVPSTYFNIDGLDTNNTAGFTK